MHDPIGLNPFRRFSSIEDERFLHPNFFLTPTDRKYRLVRSSRFPVPRRGGAVGPHAVRVLPISRAEEVPLLLPEVSLACTDRPLDKSISLPHMYTHNRIEI